MVEERADEVPARVRAARERFRAALSPNYRPWLHLAAPFVTGALVIALCVAWLEAPALHDLLVVPVLWLVAIATEWRFHRDFLHRQRPPLHFYYIAHAVQHHAMYVEGTMELAAPWELKAILLPAWATLALALLVSPIAGVFALVFGANAGLVLVASVMAYLMTYEFLHLCFHLPRRHPLRRLPAIAALARHHARHHHPGRMMFNFGVTSSLWDRVRGTYLGPGPAVDPRD